jgi:hypothetical protein
MQGNCTDAAPPGLTPSANPRQCVLTIRSDGIDASRSNLLVLEALYIRIGSSGETVATGTPESGAAANQSQSSLVIKGATELYLLDVTLLGKFGALRSRGLHIPPGGKAFAGGVLRLKTGRRPVSFQHAVAREAVVFWHLILLRVAIPVCCASSLPPRAHALHCNEQSLEESRGHTLRPHRQRTRVALCGVASQWCVELRTACRLHTQEASRSFRFGLRPGFL